MSQGPNKDTGTKLIASNPSRGNFTVQEVVEAGIVLTGTEVKSLREQSPNLKDSYVEVRSQGKSLEAWLLNTHIAPYKHGNIWNHEPLRRRKLLLHSHQIQKIYGAVTREGMTVIPTRMYFLKGKVKIELALAKGKKKHDKRQSIKGKSADREISKAMKRKR